MSTVTGYPVESVERCARADRSRADRPPSWVQPQDYVLVVTLGVDLVLWAVTGIPLLPLRPWIWLYFAYVTRYLFGGLGLLLLLRLVVRVCRRGWIPAKHLRVMLSRHLGVRRLACAGRFLISLMVIMTIQTSIKQSIPLVNGARYDAELIDIERWLHLGFNPAWDLAASNAPLWWKLFLDTCYYMWFPAMPLVAAYFLTHRNRRKRDHYLASFLGIWIVGVLLGLSFPSHGPCYVDPARFPTADMPFCGVTQNWLGEHYAALENIDLIGNGGMTFGCGLMALPSLHITVCVLFVIFFWREARWMRWASILFAVMTFLGSLYSGWHYAIDGYAGALIAALTAWATAKLGNTGSPKRAGARTGMAGGPRLLVIPTESRCHRADRGI